MKWTSLQVDLQLIIYNNFYLISITLHDIHDNDDDGAFSELVISHVIESYARV